MRVRVMDLKKYTLEDLLLAAMKSEIESHAVYTSIATQVKNGLLKDKFKFLAQEEKKTPSVHRTGVQGKVSQEKNHDSRDNTRATPLPPHA